MRINAIDSYYKWNSNSVRNNNLKLEQSDNFNVDRVAVADNISFGNVGKAKNLFWSVLIFLVSQCSSDATRILNNQLIEFGRHFKVGHFVDSIEYRGRMFYPARYSSGADPQIKSIYYKENIFGARDYYLEVQQPYVSNTGSASDTNTIGRIRRGGEKWQAYKDADNFTKYSQCNDANNGTMVVTQILDLNPRLDMNPALEKYVKKVAIPLPADKVNFDKVPNVSINYPKCSYWSGARVAPLKAFRYGKLVYTQ